MPHPSLTSFLNWLHKYHFEVHKCRGIQLAAGQVSTTETTSSSLQSRRRADSVRQAELQHIDWPHVLDSFSASGSLVLVLSAVV